MVGAAALTTTAEVDDDEAAEPVATTTTTSLDQALATGRSLSSETVTVAAEPVQRPGSSHDTASDDAPATIASTPSERRDSHDEILGTVFTLGRIAVSASWRLGVVASVVRRMNAVTLRRARLVLGWVTVFGRVYHHGM